MPTFTITIPDSLVISSRNVEDILDVTKLNADTIAKLCLHGAGQKGVDSASQAAGLAVKDKFGDKAKVADHKTWLATPEATAAVRVHTAALISKALRALEDNVWSLRGTGVGAVSEEQTVQRIVAKAAYKSAVAETVWKDFLALDKGTQAEKMDKLWEKNAEKLAAKFAHEMEVRKAKRNAPKASELDIDI